jgi:hypothetical protein
MSAPPHAAPQVAHRTVRLRPSDVVAACGWLAGLVAVLALPYAVEAAGPGESVVRNTVRLALAWYAAALFLMLCLRPADWLASAGRGRLARWCWTFAWVTYLVHVAMAFHHFHHWSHAEAVEHTRQVSGVGEGVYVSYLFTLLWTADVAAWWLGPARYARRARRVDGLLHGFMLFMVFNATVVYERGPIRWAGLALFAVLAVLVGWRFRVRRGGG